MRGKNQYKIAAVQMFPFLKVYNLGLQCICHWGMGYDYCIIDYRYTTEETPIMFTQLITI